MPWYGNILKQEQAQSCGYCCIGMIINLLGHGKPPEGSIVNQAKTVSGYYYDRATQDIAGAVPSPILLGMAQNGQTPHWGTGTYGDHLTRVLITNYGINARYNSGISVKEIMRSVSPKHPAIVLVQWTAGGGHWVVVSQRSTHLGRASDYTILDPGLTFSNVNKGSTTYTPPYGVIGHFANYSISIR